MWGSFALAALFGAASLFAPGFLLFRGIGFSRLPALSCAPLFSLAAYCVLGIVYPLVGITANAASIILPTLAFAGVVSCVRTWRLGATRRVSEKPSSADEKRSESQSPRPAYTLSDYCLPALYVAAAAATACWALLASLGAADAVIGASDNIHHYGQIEAFVASGNWSLATTTLYPEGYGADVSPFPDHHAYYPAGWHIIAALEVSALGVPVTLAANATNFIFSALVYPLGMWLLIARLFPGQRATIACGALAASAFATFPWGLLGVWELYPNTASLCLLPATAACFVSSSAPGASLRCRVREAAGFVLGIGCFAFLQPSTAFSAALMLAPLCVQRIAAFLNARGTAPWRTTACCAAFSLGAAALWVALTNAPLVRDAASWFWKPIMAPAEAVLHAATLSFAESTPQLLLALTVWGGGALVVKHRQSAWLAVSCTLSALVFVIAVSGSDTPLKHWVAGYWYTDYYRCAAMTAVFATPLAAVGMAWAVKQAGLLGRAVAKRKPRAAKACATTVAAVLFLAFTCSNFAPGQRMPDGTWNDTAFGHVKGVAASHSSALSQSSPYSESKRAFAEEARRIAGDDAPLINVPYDGSLFAFGAQGLNLYERYVSGYDARTECDLASTGETYESLVIRQGLNRIDNDPRVREAVNTIGAEYVMVLDRNEERMGYWYHWYRTDAWIGITSIQDDTPGFEVVLAEGDMRLYRILPER